MSIITDALKKAQKERSKPDMVQPTETAPVDTQGTSMLRPRAERPASSQLHALLAAGITLSLVTICAVVVLFVNKPTSDTPSENASVVPATMPAVSPAPGPERPVRSEPFSFTFPHATTKPLAPARSTPELNGIMYLPTSPQAVINGRTVKEGDTFDGYTVIKIYPESVKLFSNGSETELKLR